MMTQKNWMRMVLLTVATSAVVIVAGAGEAAALSCLNDDDCPNLACGGEVCNWDNFLTCQPAGMVEAGKDGWCMDDTDCKCKAQGATCNTTTYHCTFTVMAAGTGGASGTGSGGASGTGSGGASGTGSGGSNADAGTPPKDSGGGGCSVAPAPASGLFSVLASVGLLGALLAGRSRRRRG